MNLKASATFKAAPFAALERKIVGLLMPACSEGAGLVRDEAKNGCPVDTGDLSTSITDHPPESITGTMTVRALVTAGGDGVGYATFVEYGTGLVGSGTYPYELPKAGVPYTGTWVYDFRNQGWKGHTASPFLRPAIDICRDGIQSAFIKRGFRLK